MGKATEIILSYSKGEITVEEANKRLAECTVGLRLDPMKNAITGAEMAQTHSDGTPAGTSGYGFMELALRRRCTSQRASWTMIRALM